MKLNNLEIFLNILFPKEGTLPSGGEILINSFEKIEYDKLKHIYQKIELIKLPETRSDCLKFLSKELGPHDYRILISHMCDVYFSNEKIYNYMYDD